MSSTGGLTVFEATNPWNRHRVKGESLDGKVIVPPMDVPAGRFAIVADPQGASFALFEGKLNP